MLPAFTHNLSVSGTAFRSSDEKVTPQLVIQNHSEFNRISFQDLAALFIITGGVQPLSNRVLRLDSEEADDFSQQYSAFVTDCLRDPEVLTDPRGVSLHADERIGPWLERNPVEYLKLIKLFQSRVVLENNRPVRLYPFSREPAQNVPRLVVIDPEIRFGRPSIRGVPTDVIMERFAAGDSTSELADDYGLSTEEIDETTRYEGLPECPMIDIRSIAI